MKKIINKKPIAILLATYNAGKYLSEQIESILHQTLKDKWTLYIQDDGSKDDTISIIQEYEKTILTKSCILISGSLVKDVAETS